MVARSVIEGKVTLEAVVRVVKDPRVLVETLKAYKERKGEKELQTLVQDSGIAILPLILPPSSSPADTDAFLARHGLLALKPIPDLTADISALLSSSSPPQQIIDALNAALPPSTPIPALTKLITAHVFTVLFSSPATPSSTPSSSLPPFLPLLSRVANDAHARLLTLYAAQAAWFKAGGVKGALRDVMGALKQGGVVRGVDVVGWRDDLVVGKGVGGKPKALLQVSGWVKEVEEEVKRERPREEVEEDEGEDEEDDDDEDEDEDEESYPSRR